MWYATEQPRQQFVLEEAIAYDAPLAGLGAFVRARGPAVTKVATKMARRPTATAVAPAATIAPVMASAARPGCSLWMSDAECKRVQAWQAGAPARDLARRTYQANVAAQTDSRITKYTLPIEKTRARAEAGMYNTLEAQLARQAAALQAQYEQQYPELFRDPNIVARSAPELPWMQSQVQYVDPNAPTMQIDPATGRMLQGLSGFGALGRGGRYARSMRAIQPLKGVPRGRVIIPEGYTAESLKAAYDPRAQARQDIAQILAAQSWDSGQEMQPQVAARSARQGRQFSEALWQDPRITAMLQPDPVTGWARMSIGQGMGKEAYAAKLAAQQEAKTTKFLQSPAGADWAKTPQGQAWGQSEAGQKWQSKVYSDFMRTPAGQAWAQTPAGRKWGASAVQK